MTEYLAMGGYGFYVWGAYGVIALCVLAELLSVRARRRAAAKLAAVTPRTEELR
jgi:heme exporter protein D